MKKINLPIGRVMAGLISLNMIPIITGFVIMDEINDETKEVATFLDGFIVGWQCLGILASVAVGIALFIFCLAYAITGRIPIIS